MNNLIILLTSFMFITSCAFNGVGRERLHQDDEYFDGKEEDIIAEIKFGKNVAAQILAKYPIVENKKINQYVNHIGSGIVASLGRTDLKYYFAVIDNDEINAFATPGGYIFITKGALKNMTNEAELVGVLAHEISHVNRRHIVKTLDIKNEDKDLFSGLTSLIGGEAESFTKVVDKGLHILSKDGLKPKMEKQSDYDAIKALIVLGYSPYAYKSYIKRMSAKKDLTKTVSKTHPSARSRLKTINYAIRKFRAPKGLSTKSKRLRKYKRIANI